MPNERVIQNGVFESIPATCTKGGALREGCFVKNVVITGSTRGIGFSMAEQGDL